MKKRLKKYYKTNKIFLVLLLLILCNRLFLILNSQITLFSDDAIYAELARFFSQDKFSMALHPTWQPLYPLVVSIVHLFTGSWENSLRLTALIFFVISVIVLYELAKIFFKKKAATTIALAYSLLPTVFTVSIAPMSDMTSASFILLSILFFTKFLKEKKNKYLFLTSFGWGLTYLTRTEGLLFFYLTATYLFLILFFRVIKTKKLFSNFKILLIFVAIFFVTILPYNGYLSTKMGYFPLSHKATAQLKQGHAFKLENGTTWSQEIVSVQNPNYKSSYFTGGLSYALRYSDWLYFWFKQKMVAWQHVYSQTFSSLLFISIGLGVISSLKKERRKLLYPLYLLSISIPITVFGTAISDMRYLLWTLPLMLIFLFSGISLFFKNKQWLASVLFIFLSLTSMTLYPIRKPKEYASGITRSNYQPEILDASKFLHTRSEHPILMSRHEGLEFYAEGKTVYIPQELTIEDLINYGQSQGAEYLIAWKREIFAEGNYKELFSPDYTNDKLGLIYTSDKILIYEIK